MNNYDTTGEKGILGELLTEKSERVKSFDALTVSSVLFMAVALVDFIFDIERRSVKVFEWDLAISILVLPFIGLLFHLAKKRIGWVINCFYYLSITLLFLYSFLQSFVEKNGALEAIFYWRSFLFTTLTLISTILIFSSSMRKYFGIRTPLFIVISILSVALAIILILTSI